MTIGTRLFWVVVAGLLVASAAFASRVEARRARGAASAAEASPAVAGSDEAP